MKNFRLYAVSIGTFALGTLYSLAAGNTYYVDCKLGSYEGERGGSWETAFKTIQEGVEKASSGDTVLVASGDYDEGGRVELGHTNRVAIVGKDITLKAKEGDPAPRIVGAYDTEAGPRLGYTALPNLGPAAVRCVAVIDSKAVVQGFVLTGGACGLENNSPSDKDLHSGGGVVCKKSTDYDLDTKFVDCTIEKCYATRGGGARGGTFIRCRFLENQASVNAAAMRNGAIHFCVIARNGTNPAKAAIGYATSVKGHVNNTFVNNGSSPLDNNGGCHYNALFLKNGGTSLKTDVTFVTNCVLPKATTSADKEYWGGDAGIVYPDYDYLLVAPPFDDFRPVAGTPAVDCGDAQYLDLVPEGYRDRDLEGNAIVETDGKVTAGCCTVSVTTEGGAVAFAADLTVNGRPFRGGEWMYATTYPCYFVVEDASKDGKPLMYLAANEGCTTKRWYPQWKGRKTYLMPPPGTAKKEYYSVNPVFADKVLWADAESKAETENGSKTTPYKTLKAAVEAAGTTRTVIYAKPGRYDRGETDGGSYCMHSNRVFFAAGSNIALISTEGASRTFIVGSSATVPYGEGDRPPDAYGRGANAVRCVAVDTKTAGLVQGFTLTDGRAGITPNESDTNYCYCGGFMAGSTQAVLADSVITNCVGSRAGASYQGTLQRCLVTCNRSTNNGPLRQGVWSSCVLRDNKSSAANDNDMHINGFSCHCTGVGNAERSLNATYSGVTVCNSVFLHYRQASAVDGASSVGNFLWDSTHLGTGFANEDPCVVDQATDLHLFAHSPAIRAASVPSSATYDYFLYMTTDFEGNPYPFFRDAEGRSSTISGAFATPVASIVADDSFTHPGSYAAGEVGTTTTLEIDQAKARQRPFLGISTNGVFAPGATSVSYTVPAETVYAPFRAEAVYGTNWYVNASAANDDGFGSTPETARRTLAGVLANAYSGDCVHAAAGAYAEGGTKAFGPSDLILTRAVVPEGVSLVSDSPNGAADTAIVGALDTDDGNTEGCGPKAMRCVYLGKSARLAGFTIRDGRTNDHRLNGSDTTDKRAGGIYAWADDNDLDAMPDIVDCVITNCTGSRGGGFFGGNLRRTTIVDCHSIPGGNGPGGRTARLYNCRAYGNTAAASGTAPLYMMYGVYNCTIGPADETAEYLAVYAHLNVFEGLVNTLFLGGSGGTLLTLENSSTFENCVISNNVARYAFTLPNKPANVEVLYAGNNFGNAKGTVDADGRPSVDYEGVVDGGALNDTFASYVAGVDCAGEPRIRNRTIDVGCYEADWKARYGADLGRRVTVTEASSDVLEVVPDGGAKRLELVDGSSLALDWASGLAQTHGWKFCVKVTGGGTLTWTRGTVSEDITTEDETTLAFEADTDQTLAFAYTGAGKAEIWGLKQEIGSLLIVR